MPEPQASLAQGIILGIRTNIPASLEDDFVRSGTAHILAISGINLTIVAGILVSLGIWAFGRRRYTYIWVALSIIWLYTLLTGLHPPALRAAIMVSLFLTADFLGRQRSGIIALFLAAAIMVGINPQVSLGCLVSDELCGHGRVNFYLPTPAITRQKGGYRHGG